MDSPERGLQVEPSPRLEMASQRVPKRQRALDAERRWRNRQTSQPLSDERAAGTISAAWQRGPHVGNRSNQRHWHERKAVLEDWSHARSHRNDTHRRSPIDVAGLDGGGLGDAAETNRRTVQACPE